VAALGRVDDDDRATWPSHEYGETEDKNPDEPRHEEAGKGK
jgi:hypothetical protein